jgi:thiol oxidase
LEQSNKVLCERFNVQSYPTMYLGPPEILASGSWATKGKRGLDSVEGKDVVTADDLLEWVNKHINK